MEHVGLALLRDSGTPASEEHRPAVAGVST